MSLSKQNQTVRGQAIESRAAVYGMLAQCLYYPGHEICTALENGKLQQLIGKFRETLPRSHRRAISPEVLCKFRYSGSGESASRFLLTEYTKLFSLNLHCPQYEADYLAPSLDSTAHSIASVSNMYLTFGMRLADHVTERPDHIAIELDFMYFLATKEARAFDGGQYKNRRACRHAQAFFLKTHLLRWGYQFARNLSRAISCDFYNGVQSILVSFLSAETKHLGIQLSKLPVSYSSRSTNSGVCGCATSEAISPANPHGLVTISGIDTKGESLKKR